MNSELSNIANNSETALKAANAYSDIIDGINAAQNYTVNAKQAARNATDLVIVF